MNIKPWTEGAHQVGYRIDLHIHRLHIAAGWVTDFEPVEYKWFYVSRNLATYAVNVCIWRFRFAWKINFQQTKPMSERTQIPLGAIAKDRVTGFTGMVIARTQWLMGCDRYVVQPRELKDGKPIESQSFDIGQLDVLEENAFNPEPKPEAKPKAKTGGPRPEPTRR